MKSRGKISVAKIFIHKVLTGGLLEQVININYII